MTDLGLRILSLAGVCALAAACALQPLAAEADHLYIRFDKAADRADPGYPKEIRCCWPGVWPSGVDAAVNWGNGKAYFFSGDQYVRYDLAKDRVDPGYPKYVNEQTWPGLPALGRVDAAVNWGNGKAYFFGDRGYVRYDIRADRVDPGYPKRITEGAWAGVPFRSVGAALSWNGGKTYLFER